MLLLALLPLLSPCRPAAEAPGAAHRRTDPVERLAVWIERRRRAGRGQADEEALAELRGLLGDVRIVEDAAPERSADVLDALLSLAALDHDWSTWSPGQGPPEGSMATIALGELQDRLDRRGSAGLFDRLTAVLADGRSPRGQRVIAAVLLEDRRLNGTLNALLQAAWDPSEALARAAQTALAGWDEERVQHFFLDGLERGTTLFRPTLAHFQRTRDGLSVPVRDKLRAIVAQLCLSTDWRDAVRGRQLVSALDAGRAVPILLESLRAWNRRLARGTGSRRVSHELLGELRRISGRSLGTDPDRWERWWRAVRDGTIELPADTPEEDYSSAAFFGLQPVSDRLVFVIDRSQSMETRFGSSGRTRYEEAVAQLFRYLGDAGVETRFRVVLFNDEAQRWRDELRYATAANLSQLEGWLAARRPEGGTRLHEGVLEGLRLERGTREVLAEVDTVIVLCDGETEEGPGWVRGWLARIHERSQVVFHCVGIGGTGDGTLEALADGTGGQLIDVGG